jgi:polar amino acid transport system substrate-binding protein
VVFGSVKISGVLVSIIGFALIFGASVYERMKAGVAAVDIGQTEAAYSLGYTERQAFYKVVLPQAMPYIFPPFKGDITTLLKGTSVVGFIAVQDLTKMADVVRSRTYEAFFPLIAVAIIYFILEILLNFIVDRIEPVFYPKRREPDDILKGVQQK